MAKHRERERKRDETAIVPEAKFLLGDFAAATKRRLLLRKYSYSGRRSSVDPLRNTPWKRSLVSVSLSLPLSRSFSFSLRLLSRTERTRVTCGFRKLLRANQPADPRADEPRAPRCCLNSNGLSSTRLQETTLFWSHLRPRYPRGLHGKRETNAKNRREIHGGFVNESVLPNVGTTALLLLFNAYINTEKSHGRHRSYQK